MTASGFDAFAKSWREAAPERKKRSDSMTSRTLTYEDSPVGDMRSGQGNPSPCMTTTLVSGFVAGSSASVMTEVSAARASEGNTISVGCIENVNTRGSGTVFRAAHWPTVVTGGSVVGSGGARVYSAASPASSAGTGFG